VLLDLSGAAFGIIPVFPAEAIPPTDRVASRDATARVGRIAWLDLTVTDASATRDFYRRVVGWSVQDVGMEDAGERYADSARASVAYRRKGARSSRRHGPTMGRTHMRRFRIRGGRTWHWYLGNRIRKLIESRSSAIDAMASCSFITTARSRTTPPEASVACFESESKQTRGTTHPVTPAVHSQ
jgi:predicted enzyme related to lactoylglutathione lyase